MDKFEPVSFSGEVEHSEEAAGELVVSGGDGAVDLEVAEHALDAVSLLVEIWSRPVGQLGGLARVDLVCFYAASFSMIPAVA